MKIKILIIAVAIIICFFIYKYTSKENNVLVAIGDNSCLATSIYGANGYSYNDYIISQNKALKLDNRLCFKGYNIVQILNIITSNKVFNKLPAKSLIHNAKYIIINIGFDELSSYKDLDNIKKREFLDNYTKLLHIIKENTTAKVYVIGFYPDYFKDSHNLNKELEMMCYNLGYTFINPEKALNKEEYFYNTDYYNLNELGNKKLGKLIMEFL